MDLPSPCRSLRSSSASCFSCSLAFSSVVLLLSLSLCGGVFLFFPLLLGGAPKLVYVDAGASAGRIRSVPLLLSPPSEWWRTKPYRCPPDLAARHTGAALFRVAPAPLSRRPVVLWSVTVLLRLVGEGNHERRDTTVCILRERFVWVEMHLTNTQKRCVAEAWWGSQ